MDHEPLTRTRLCPPQGQGIGIIRDETIGTDEHLRVNHVLIESKA
jgi:hypothetical protein